MKVLLPLFLAVAAAAACTAEPVFSCRGNVPGNIQFAAGPVRLELRFENRGSLAGEVTELVRLADFHGNGEAPLRRRVMMEPAGVLEREIVIPPECRGAFRLTYSLMRNGELVFSRDVTGAILEPVKALDPENSPIGMYCYNLHWNGKRELPVLRNMGISWIRANLSWGRSEPERGRFDWKQGDDSSRLLKEYGMHAMFNLVYPPRWAVDRVNMYGGNPADFGDYAAFAARAAARYLHIRHWSIWNEPDAESHWEGGGAEFARLLKATAPAIRAANPEAKVLPGGVTGSPALAERFYRELQRAGARPDFDIYEYHYRNIGLHRRLLREFGWRDMPLWNTEAAEGAEKAAQLVRETVSGLAAGVERTFIFLYAIPMTRPEEFEEFGPVVMVDNDGRPTGNFPVVYTMSRQLNGIRECRELSSGGLRLFSCRYRDGGPRYILWSSTGARAATLKCGGELRITDATGTESRLVPFEGFISVPVSEVTYLDGAEVTPAAERAMAEIGTPRTTPVFGNEFEIPLSFHNPAPGPFHGQAVLSASPDWEAATAEIPLTLAPGERREVLCRLKPRRLADRAETRLTLQLYREDGALTGCDTRDIRLTTALDFTLRPAFRWGEPRVRADIANPTASPIEASIRFRVPGSPEKTAAMPVTLPALATSHVYFDPEPAEGESRGEAEAVLTFPGGTVRRSAKLDWIALKPAGNPPVILQERSDYIAPSRILFQWDGPADLSVKANLDWDERHFKLTADVTDDVHSADPDPALLWQRDSMQIWFDGMLFDLGLNERGAVLFRHDKKSAGMKIPFSVVREGNTTRYRIAFPKPDGSPWKENDTVRFAFIVNDADLGAERKGWMYYLSDIGDPRCRPATPEITLVKE